ncbi:MAG: citrate (Si)-synthase, partial [Halobacteriovoraceae bacterium]|nr:citrate (Si)-synthase [Halobacteriovoraceae bacterium]
MSQAKLQVNGKEYNFPVVTGTENETAVDITSLRSKSGIITLDNGYMNTGACQSSITFLDGEKGVLYYRGYPIEQLAEKSSFIESSYLLIYGELPTKAQLDEFNSYLSSFTTLPKGVNKIIDQFSKDVHPMGVIGSTIMALSGFYPDFSKLSLSEREMEQAIAQLMGQLKVIMAYFYRRSNKLSPIKSQPSLGYCADFINMMFYKKGYEVDHEIARALNVLLILHADHEQNCSASTVRMVGSSKANIFATIAAGVAALWGPLHGGANQAVLEMLEKIRDNGGDYKKFLAKAKDKKNPFRLMGFGHRVYKNFDPRAKIIKNACNTVLKKLGVKDPLLGIAKGLEEEALKDSYFIERNL